LIAEIGDVGVALEEPEELVNDRAKVQFFRGNEWEALAQVKAFLSAKNGIRSCARAVGFDFSLLENELQKAVILLHEKAL